MKALLIMRRIYLTKQPGKSGLLGITFKSESTVVEPTHTKQTRNPQNMKYLISTLQLRKAFTHYVYYTEKGLNGLEDNNQNCRKTFHHVTHRGKGFGISILLHVISYRLNRVS